MPLRRWMLCASLLAASVWLSACQTAPPIARVVLLPDPDGRVGSVVVKSAMGEQVLSTSMASASLMPGGTLQAGQLEGAAVRQHYAGLLDATPPRAVSFVVYFEFGSSVDFIAASRPVLDQLRSYLRSHPAPEIVVIGHTDRVGSVQANDLLSRQRAETVRGFLLEAGFQAGSMEVAGRGEREPLILTQDEVAEPLNRRVEINVR